MDIGRAGVTIEKIGRIVHFCAIGYPVLCIPSSEAVKRGIEAPGGVGSGNTAAGRLQ